eukprot:scaffold34790_cov45-Phaeocystis_antarctica.AAC.1
MQGSNPQTTSRQGHALLLELGALTLALALAAALAAAVALAVALSLGLSLSLSLGLSLALALALPLPLTLPLTLTLTLGALDGLIFQLLPPQYGGALSSRLQVSLNPNPNPSPNPSPSPRLAEGPKAGLLLTRYGLEPFTATPHCNPSLQGALQVEPGSG